MVGFEFPEGYNALNHHSSFVECTISISKGPEFWWSVIDVQYSVWSTPIWFFDVDGWNPMLLVYSFLPIGAIQTAIFPLGSPLPGMAVATFQVRASQEAAAHPWGDPWQGKSQKIVQVAGGLCLYVQHFAIQISCVCVCVSVCVCSHDLHAAPADMFLLRIWCRYPRMSCVDSPNFGATFECVSGFPCCKHQGFVGGPCPMISHAYPIIPYHDILCISGKKVCKFSSHFGWQLTMGFVKRYLWMVVSDACDLSMTGHRRRVGLQFLANKIFWFPFLLSQKMNS